MSPAEGAERSKPEQPPPSPGSVLCGAMKRTRRIVVFVVGFTVILIGVALFVLPGPAIVVIPAGLAILATEFVWARRLLRKARAKLSGFGTMLTGRKSEERDASS